MGRTVSRTELEAGAGQGGEGGMISSPFSQEPILFCVENQGLG